MTFNVKNVYEDDDGFIHWDEVVIGGNPLLVGEPYLNEKEGVSININGKPVVKLGMYIPIKIGGFKNRLYFQSGFNSNYDGYTNCNDIDPSERINDFKLIDDTVLHRLYYTDINAINENIDAYTTDIRNIGIDVKNSDDVIALHKVMLQLTPILDDSTIESLNNLKIRKKQSEKITKFYTVVISIAFIAIIIAVAFNSFTGLLF